MRLPLCSKRETDIASDIASDTASDIASVTASDTASDIAFRRINRHPLDPDDVFTCTYDETDPDAWLPFVISHPHYAACCSASALPFLQGCDINGPQGDTRHSLTNLDM
jgi:hypothetical protein